MTIRAEDFSFSMPFYVSVVVLDSDDECHLRDANYTTVPDRRKNVTVSIVTGDRYGQYVAPIGASVVVSAVLIIFACVVMGTKRLGDMANEEVEEGDSVYYSPSGSRPDVDDVLTYSLRPPLMRCWNSCAMTPVVTESTKPVLRRLPFTTPSGSGVSR